MAIQQVIMTTLLLYHSLIVGVAGSGSIDTIHRKLIQSPSNDSSTGDHYTRGKYSKRNINLERLLPSDS